MGMYAELIEGIKEMYLTDRGVLIEGLRDMKEDDRAKRIDKSPSTKRAGEMHARRRGLQGFIDYQNLLWRLKQPPVEGTQL